MRCAQQDRQPLKKRAFHLKPRIYFNLALVTIFESRYTTTNLIMRAMTRSCILFALGLCFTFQHAQAQTATDTTAIRQRALDYIEGWYTGDTDRMSSAVHSKLVKRIFATHPKTGQQVFKDQDSTALVTATEQGHGSKIPDARRQEAITILDVFRDAASVKIVAAGWIDYLHLAKVNGDWQIVNVLWEMKPEREQGGS